MPYKDIEVKRAYDRERGKRIRNTPARKTAVKKYCDSHREELNLKSEEYRNSNLEKTRAAVRSWRTKYPYKNTAKSAKYRASKLQATPVWSEIDQIKRFYESCPKGWHVDHIVPLKNSIVCGLHVLVNLQYLPASTNCSKSNIFKENIYGEYRPS